MSEDVKIALPRSLQEIIGSLLFASQDPLTASELREAVRSVECEEGENREIMDVYRTCTNKEVEQALRGLEKALEVGGCGFQLVCTGGTYRLQTTPSCGRYVRAMLKLDRPNRLGRASLETLAIIAYRQPITRAEIEEIRGVDISANIKTLTDLQLIRLVGKSELPGHPFLYGTTPLFLEHFGLANLEALNQIDPTLQRSNPRVKAESYKKKEVKKVEDEVEDEAEEKAKVEGQGQEEGEEGSKVQGLRSKDEEEDIVIDDTPDEFDEEDEDDEEDEEEEDDEES